MSHSAGDSPGSVDPVQVSRDAVTLDREIEVRDEGVVVTYRLAAGDEEAVSATVVDAVPEDLPTADAGFHPENEPYEWSLEDREVAFETVVPDEGERIVVFGIAVGEDGPEDVEFADPELSAVDPVNPAVADEDMDITLPDVDEPDRADAIAEVIEGSGDPPAGDEGGEDEPGASSDEIEAALEGLSEPDESGDGTDESADRDDRSADDLELDLEDGGSVDADDATGDGTPADGSDPAEAEGGETPPGGEMAVPEGGLVEALVAELESGEVEEPERAALAEAIGVDEDGPDRDSLDVRLSHVQSRMDDFAAYADALEEIIDEHGTADAFMTEIREEVEMVDERVEDVHERLDDVDSRLDELTGMESRLDELADDAADSEAVGELEDAVADLRSDVEDVQRVRETLLEAFGDSASGNAE